MFLAFNAWFGFQVSYRVNVYLELVCAEMLDQQQLVHFFISIFQFSMLHSSYLISSYSSKEISYKDTLGNNYVWWIINFNLDFGSYIHPFALVASVFRVHSLGAAVQMLLQMNTLIEFILHFFFSSMFSILSKWRRLCTTQFYSWMEYYWMYDRYIHINIADNWTTASVINVTNVDCNFVPLLYSVICFVVSWWVGEGGVGGMDKVCSTIWVDRHCTDSQSIRELSNAYSEDLWRTMSGTISLTNQWISKLQATWPEYE